MKATEQYFSAVLFIMLFIIVVKYIHDKAVKEIPFLYDWLIVSANCLHFLLIMSELWAIHSQQIMFENSGSACIMQ